MERRELLQFAFGICAISCPQRLWHHAPIAGYEPPLAKSDFQTVRTTAYTHTESDHVEFSNHNALGGELHAAARRFAALKSPHAHRAMDDDGDDYRQASLSDIPLQPFSMTETRTSRRSAYGSAIKRTTTTARGHIWKRSGRLVALAGRDNFSAAFDRTDLPGR